MMPLPQKRLSFILGVLILIGGIFFVLTWKQSENRKSNVTTSTQSKPVAPNPLAEETSSSTTQMGNAPQSTSSTNEAVTVAPYNELVSNTADGQTIKNTQCDFTYKIPVGWSVGGLFGGSIILSPEDQRTNEEWDKAHQDLIQHQEGDTPPGPDAKSLSIGCEDNIDAYKKSMPGLVRFNDFENAQNLAEAIASSAFHATNTNLALVKTIKINGWDAYEIDRTNRGADGVRRTFYSIVLEKGKIYDFTLDFTEYDKLSPAVKQIIQSISFEK